MDFSSWLRSETRKYLSTLKSTATKQLLSINQGAPRAICQIGDYLVPVILNRGSVSDIISTHLVEKLNLSPIYACDKTYSFYQTAQVLVQ